MTKFAIGDTVRITGGFEAADGFDDLYQYPGIVERVFEETEHISEHYAVKVNGTVAHVRYDHLAPSPARADKD